MKTSEVIAYLDQVMHPEYQEDYDNSGFLVGDSRSDYRGALVALDMTEAVLDEALGLGLNLIVTHHPFIFGSGLRRLTDRTVDGRLVMRLLQGGVCLYAAHTNLDNLPWGVSGALAQRIGLTDCHLLRESQPGVGSGMVGDLPVPEAADAFLTRIKALLGLPSVRHYPSATADGPRLVRRVALCGGSGAFLTPDALSAGADIYLTADLKYHDFQRTDGRMILADIGHYESEQFAKDVIFSTISGKFSNFACRISVRQGGIVGYI